MLPTHIQNPPISFFIFSKFLWLFSNIDIKRLRAPELRLGWKAPSRSAPGSSAFNLEKIYYKVLLQRQYSREVTQWQTCCLNVCPSVATVCVTEFSLAVLTSCRVVLIGCLNCPCRGQSQFVYIICKNMAFWRVGGYLLRILMWSQWFIRHFRTACSLYERQVYMVQEIIMTQDVLKLQYPSFIYYFYVISASLDTWQITFIEKYIFWQSRDV